MTKLEQNEPERNFLLLGEREGRAAAFWHLAAVAYFRDLARCASSPDHRALLLQRARYHLNTAQYFCETRFLRVRLP